MLNQASGPNINFNQPGFEQVKVLYTDKKTSYEKNHIETKNDKEIMKEAINDIFEKEINKVPLMDKGVNVNSFSVFANDDDDDEKRTNMSLESLVRIAFEKGIGQAILLSRKTGNAYLMDRLHDILVDKFYEELIKQNKITK
jgi:hypothetical protein